MLRPGFSRRGKTSVTFAVTLLAFAIVGAEVFGAPVLDRVVERKPLWETGRAGFVDEFGELGFRWLSNAQDAAQTTLTGLTLFEIPIYQTIARFEADRLKEIDVLFYNRGDAGDLPQAKFEDLLKKCVDALSNFTKSKPVVRGKDASSAVKAEGVQWQSDTAMFLLEYSFTREVKTRSIPFRAEFVRLRITPPVLRKSLLATALPPSTAPSRFNGQTHVKREPSGDVVLDGIPMVDQGQKGYCVVATAERVMKYYGLRADEHELAEIANTDASKGTSNEALFESLKKLSNRLRVKIRTLEPFEVRQILELVKEYNRAAKRGKRAPEIDTSGPVLDVSVIYGKMKPELLREARNRNKSDTDRFQRLVQTHIDQGVPLLWSVMLGIVPEAKAPQGSGGHMRLIIGYNLKTAEILYSDSWGMGHELKRMSVADAWTITTNLNTIEPL